MAFIHFANVMTRDFVGRSSHSLASFGVAVVAYEIAVTIVYLALFFLSVLDAHIFFH